MKNYLRWGVLRRIINEYINSDLENGLMLLPFPTGFGKTYNATWSIYDIASQEKKGRKVFFITTLIKNLPFKELRDRYEKEGRLQDFDKEVLLIKSNVDYVLENLPNIIVPKEFENNAYTNLSIAVNEYIKLDNNRASSMGVLKANLINLIRDEYEPQFRKWIIKIINEKLPKSILERKQIIKTEPRYQWIGKLYPTVFTEDYKVYMMSMSKFLVRNTVLVEPSYHFLNHEMLNGASVFIDEFDATKATIQEHLIRGTVDNQADFIELFIQIYHSLANHHVSGTLRVAYEKYMNKKRNTGDLIFTLRELEKEAEEITKTYHLMYCYKTKKEEINQTQNFLFSDGSYHTILRNDKKYIRVTPNIEKENNIEIVFEDHENYTQNKTDKDISIYHLIRKINVFFTKYKYLMLNWAKCYCEIENSTRDATDTEFILENALKTIYIEYGLKKEEINILMRDIGEENRCKKDEILIRDMSFYENGFKYYQFIDKDEHLTKTKFHYVQVTNTPEKVLVNLCKKAKVIGISATANIKSVLSNYDIDYIKNCLDAHFYVPQDNHLVQLKKKFNTRLEKYKEISIKTTIVDKGKKGWAVEDRLGEIFGDESYVEKYKTLFSFKLREGSAYQQARYCTIFSVFKAFISNPQIQSLLCLNMPHVKVRNASFDIEIFRRAFQDLIDLFGYRENYCVNDILVVLKGDQYEQTKNNLIERLGKGEKIFVMSSYQTIGAGQNLQYPIPEGIECISLDDSLISKVKEKDFDGIFLGNVTNVITNLDGDLEEGVSQEDLLNYLFQVEYLYQKDEISFKTLKLLIRRGFKKYSGNGRFDKSEYQYIRKLTKSRSVQLQVTKELVQAIGRICRTPNKKNEIYIYTTEEMISTIDPFCIDLELTNPEVVEILKEKEKLRLDNNSVNERINNCAERIALAGKNFIMQMLTKIWTTESMRLWMQLRDVLMKYPTADRALYDENIIVKNLFIKMPENSNRYLYAQSGDFSEVLIDFEGNRVEFEEGDGYDNFVKSEVSMEEARLQEILSYPGMKDWFVEKGFCTEFKINEYIMSPVLFHNIYKGALGENAGKFILKRELGLQLNELEDSDRFEFFDFEISQGVYIDFKHWKQSYTKDREKTREEITRKLQKINGKRVYIINILGDSDESYTITRTVDNTIVEIPYLLDKNSDVNYEAINILKGELE